jgi:hypothetical protein
VNPHRNVSARLQDFHGRRVAKERRRACGEAVRPRLADHDQITDLGPCHFHSIGKQIERRTQRANHADNFTLAADHAVAQYMAARDLAVDDPADVDARLADLVAAQFDHDPGLRQPLLHPTQRPGEVGADGRDVERTLGAKVRDAEAAAKC